ncbi:hypothetical protein ABIA15_004341 [Sinorhizobium fredii]
MSRSARPLYCLSSLNPCSWAFLRQANSPRLGFSLLQASATSWEQSLIGSLGDSSTGFTTGLVRPVKPSSLERAAGWYRRFGRWSLLLSWMPILGDALSVLAGVLRSPGCPSCCWSQSERRRDTLSSPQQRSGRRRQSEPDRCNGLAETSVAGTVAAQPLYFNWSCPISLGWNPSARFPSAALQRLYYKDRPAPRP